MIYKIYIIVVYFFANCWDPDGCPEYFTGKIDTVEVYSDTCRPCFDAVKSSVQINTIHLQIAGNQGQVIIGIITDSIH